MNFIDSKGRVFGKINLIDLIVILFFVSIIPIFYYGYKVFTGNSEIEEQKWVSVEVKYVSIMPELADITKEGDAEVNSKGKVIAKVRAIKSIKSTDVVEATRQKDQNFLIFSHPYNKDMILLMDILCKEDVTGFYYNDKFMVKVGSQFTFSPKFYNITGLIVRVSQ